MHSEKQAIVDAIAFCKHHNLAIIFKERGVALLVHGVEWWSHSLPEVVAFVSPAIDARWPDDCFYTTPPNP